MDTGAVIDVEEFWHEAQRDEDPIMCWPWRGARSKRGVGQTKWTHPETRQEKVESAHRVAWFLTYGTLPSYVMRTCGNSLCVRPQHLWSNDGSISSRRHARTWAERPSVGWTSLTSHDVLSIRHAVARGESEEALAEQYGVNQRDIARVALGRTFKNVGGPVRASYHRGIKQYHTEWRSGLTKNWDAGTRPLSFRID